MLGRTLVVGSAALAALALTAPSAHAAPGACKATVTGGVVAAENPNSSRDLVGLVDGPQKVSIDRVGLNAFGMTTYRLATDASLLSFGRTPETDRQPFVGGGGSFLFNSDIASDEKFLRCVQKKLS